MWNVLYQNKSKLSSFTSQTVTLPPLAVPWIIRHFLEHISHFLITCTLHTSPYNVNIFTYKRATFSAIYNIFLRSLIFREAAQVCRLDWPVSVLH